MLTFVLLSALAPCWPCLAEIALVTPKRGEVVPVLTEAQRAFVNLPPDAKRTKFADKNYRRKEMGLPAEVVEGETRKPAWPKTTRLSWEGKDGVTAYTVRVVGRNGDLAFDQCVTGTTVVIDNLMVATDYDWSVSASGDRGSSSFRTEDVPLRLCRFPAIDNARDLGGVHRLLQPQLGLQSREVLRRATARAQEALPRRDHPRIGRGLRQGRRHHRRGNRQIPPADA